MNTPPFVAASAVDESEHAPSNTPRWATDSIAKQPPQWAQNPSWPIGADQSSYSHRLTGLGLIPDMSQADPDAYLRRSTVKNAYGFEDWPKPSEELIPGFKLSLEGYPEFRSFEVLMDRCTASFEGDITGHGVTREIELRRASDNSAISIRLVVAMSALGAREQLVPVLRVTQEPVVEANAARINRLSVGEVNDYSEFFSGDLKRVAFARRNVFLQVEAESRLNQPVPGLDLLALATEIDRRINAIDLVSATELATLRPRIVRMELGGTPLNLSSESTSRTSLEWIVAQPRPGTLQVNLDGTGDLQYGEASSPSTVRGTMPGTHTCRLIVIDEYLLFDWEDRTVLVE